jgi:hypothetical protein
MCVSQCFEFLPAFSHSPTHTHPHTPTHIHTRTQPVARARRAKKGLKMLTQAPDSSQITHEVCELLLCVCGVDACIRVCWCLRSELHTHIRNILICTYAHTTYYYYTTHYTAHSKMLHYTTHQSRDCESEGRPSRSEQNQDCYCHVPTRLVAS